MRRITRPNRDADREEVVTFWSKVSAALNDLAIEYGEDFVIAKPNETPTEARARRGDPGTSHAAAASVADLRASQRAVLRAFTIYGPMTDEELVLRYSDHASVRQSSSGLRTRRAELVAGGHLYDTGQKRKMRSGRSAIVWGPTK
jgi:hypothetical protein